MNYHILREFADSWVLLAMFVFFVAVIVWVFRPGSRKDYQDVSTSIFRNEDTPAEKEART
ncbi:CcoQ/FixQ family Cbb3-type cytochrome c oxidase assembly chaperone [Celeribacter baekdonensis]|jgi:cytochrome c oxidase cbb3-type subunit 4|uniref:Cbb3-type cytochrome c oxidase subunit IV n=2 Tax=Rhodobacterales TaxID=204455 RepID=K2IL04_9RHOB|nr:cbb3-type cytochrome c oxidase subunit IV [Celeribacter baekdonensis B30]|tara:strand:- start:6590 stop:6769 length:180 start_codon:yes stop_codon:yes gene_type:complete